MSTLYIMVGVPGAGKTHWCRKNLPNALRISLDDLRMMFYGKDFDALQEGVIAAVRYVLVDGVLDYAKMQNRDVVYDATCISVARRRPLIYKAHLRGMDAVAVYMDTAAAIAHKRNVGRDKAVPESVLDMFLAVCVPPSGDEGLNGIMVVKEESA